MNSLPTSPGVYAVMLHLPDRVSLRVGRLGEAVFPEGRYIYCGSARGPGGLRGRLGRHLDADHTSTHWHIDYLRRVTNVKACFYMVVDDSPSIRSSSSIECLWSQALANIPAAKIPLCGFGASDCRSGCIAHLIHFPVASEEQISTGDHYVTILKRSLQQDPSIFSSDIVFIPWPTI